jgi:hypothetical protein
MNRWRVRWSISPLCCSGPDFAPSLIAPTLDDNGIAQRLMAYDPRYFTTYYAIDAVNFRPVDVSSALDALEGPYLPLVVQEAAGREGLIMRPRTRAH